MLREAIAKGRGKLDSANSLLAQRKARLEELEASRTVVERSHGICQSVAKMTQENLSVQLDSLINLALNTCFPNQYRFDTRFVENRGKTELRFVLTDLNTGKENDDIINGFGGGLVDVVSLALRLCLHSLDDSESVIVLDEPFKFLSRDLRSQAACLIRELSERLNLQFIIITHIPEIEEIGNKVFQVEKEDGISKIRVISKGEK